MSTTEDPGLDREMAEVRSGSTGQGPDVAAVTAATLTQGTYGDVGPMARPPHVADSAELRRIAKLGYVYVQASTAHALLARKLHELGYLTRIGDVTEVRETIDVAVRVVEQLTAELRDLGTADERSAVRCRQCGGPRNYAYRVWRGGSASWEPCDSTYHPPGVAVAPTPAPPRAGERRYGRPATPAGPETSAPAPGPLRQGESAERRLDAVAPAADLCRSAAVRLQREGGDSPLTQRYAERAAELDRMAMELRLEPQTLPEPPERQEPDNGLPGWFVVELMGHRRLAGHLSEVTVAGEAFLRLDVPPTGTPPEGREPVTQFYRPAAVYCLTPTTEEVARGLSATHRPEPVHRYELASAFSPRSVSDLAEDDPDPDVTPDDPDLESEDELRDLAGLGGDEDEPS